MTKIQARRAYVAVDWEIRRHVPAMLRAAGLGAAADKLESLPEITTRVALDAARAMVIDATASARGAAEVAAGDQVWLAVSAGAMLGTSAALTETDVSDWDEFGAKTAVSRL